MTELSPDPAGSSVLPLSALRLPVAVVLTAPPGLAPGAVDSALGGSSGAAGPLPMLKQKSRPASVSCLWFQSDLTGSNGTVL